MAEYMAARRKKRRSILVEKSGGRCEKCGSTETLEFNHKDRLSKKFEIASGLDKPWSTLMEEWGKCELLCRQCHLEHTKMLWDTKQLRPSNSKLHLPYIHGTVRMYQELSCRCNKCKDAKRKYRNKEVTYSDEV